MLETKELVLDRLIQSHHPIWTEVNPLSDWGVGTENRDEVLRVLDRAADDYAFIAQLTEQGSEALQSYNLTREEKAALVTGDIAWIEAHVGKLDARLSTWPMCRLEQENW